MNYLLNDLQLNALLKKIPIFFGCKNTGGMLTRARGHTNKDNRLLVVNNILTKICYSRLFTVAGTPSPSRIYKLTPHFSKPNKYTKVFPFLNAHKLCPTIIQNTFRAGHFCMSRGNNQHHVSAVSQVQKMCRNKFTLHQKGMEIYVFSEHCVHPFWHLTMIVGWLRAFMT